MASSVDLDMWSICFVADLQDEWLSVFIMAGIEPHPQHATRDEVSKLRKISKVQYMYTISVCVLGKLENVYMYM